jgi:hypothetical protein
MVATEVGKQGAEAAADLGSVMPELDKLTGYVVAGVRVVDNGVEIRTRSIDQPRTTGAGIDALAALNTMPRNAALAAATGGLEGIGAGTNPLGNLFGGGMTTLPALLGLDPALAQTAGSPGLPEDPETGATPAPQDEAGTAVSAIISALSTAGSVEVAVAGGPGKPDTLPPVKVGVTMSDETSAKDLAKGLRAMARAIAPVENDIVITTQQGRSVQVHTPGFTAADGALADSPLFEEAMAGAPAAPTSAVYIDVHTLATTLGVSADDMHQLVPVKAIGITTGHSGNDSSTLVRIVVH